MLSLGFLLKADTAQAKEALDALTVQTEAATAALQGDFEKAGTGIQNKLMSVLPTFGLVAGGVAAVGGALFEMANKASEAGDKLFLASKRTGVSVEMLQGLGLAAKESGVNIDTVENALERMTRSAGPFATSGSQGAKALKSIGISATDVDGKMRPLDDLLLDVAHKFAHMKDGSEKTAIAVSVFGRAGAQMIPILDKGRAALKKLTDEAVQMSGITTEAAAKDHQFQDQLTLTKAEAEGLAVKLGTRLVPVFGVLVDAINHPLISLEKLLDYLTLADSELESLTDHLLHWKSAQKAADAETIKEDEDIDRLNKSLSTGSEYAGDYAKLQQAMAQAAKDASDKTKDHTKATRDDAVAMHEAARKAFEESSAFQQMRRELELTNEAQQKAAELAHEKIEAAKEHAALGPEAPGGLIQLPQTMATISTTLPAIKEKTDSLSQSFLGLSQMINNMSASFGRGGAGMAQFSQDLQKVMEAHQKGMPIMTAFLQAQRQQGETAKEAGSSMAMSYGMEAASFIKNKRAQAIVMAIMETAKGLSEMFWNPAAAAMDFASAAMYGVIAGTSGGGASSAGGGGGGGRGTSSHSAGQTVAGGGLLSGSGGGGNYHQSVVNIYGGQITDTNNLQNLVTALNQGGQSGTVRMNVAGTSATIPTPAY